MVDSFADYYQKYLKKYTAEKKFTTPNLQLVVSANLAENPLCGDKITLYFTELSAVKQIYFQAEACSVVQASAVILCQLYSQYDLFQLKQWAEQLEEFLFDRHSFDAAPPLITDLFGIKDFPARLKCALLPWSVLKNCRE